ncbi:hypothetical protein TNCV_2998721 [Trichonephila clavipes]|nr:hypothetical protein TNCV_2998721 [Trichonephila clavipes]
MRVRRIKEEFKGFKSGRTLVESDQRSRRPETAKNAAVVEKVENLIMKDRRLTARETAEQVKISTGSPHAILYDHEESSGEFCSQASVGGTKNSVLQLHRTYWILSSMNLVSCEF